MQKFQTQNVRYVLIFMKMLEVVALIISFVDTLLSFRVKNDAYDCSCRYSFFPIVDKLPIDP